MIFTYICNAQHSEIQGMSLIPGGELTMGKSDDLFASPEHKVIVDSFYLDQKEVTNAEYFQFCQETGYHLPEFWGMDAFKSGADYLEYPVVGISSFDALKYAEWAGKRLPTEAEWEYAARGGLVANDFPFGSKIDSSKANYNRKYKGIIEVGSFEPNAYGLYDMAGNVWEWVSDYYSTTYYGESAKENPKGPDNGRFRIIRGGSWHSGAMCLRVYYRNALSPSWVDFAVGFRCAKNIVK